MKGEAVTRKACDQLIYMSARTMMENGASMSMVLDRFLTFSAGQACLCDGAFNAAVAFRQIADKIEAGTFAHLEPVRGEQKH
jgi:hypothetical protein